MPVSEARNDDVPLLRLAYPAFTGHLGMIAPHGATFVDGVAQNGVTEMAALRLIGCIGPSLSIVGPWESTSAPAGPTAPTPGSAHLDAAARFATVAASAAEPAPLPRPSKPARRP